MVTSFRGERLDGSKDRSRRILVEDYMTKDLILFKPTQSIIEVMEVLANNPISGGPVVDENGALLGIISEADCMKKISDSRYYNMPMSKDLVGEFMTKNVETIESSKDIFDAATLFHKHNRRRLPVVKDHKLVGQISRKDIVVAALKLESSNLKK